MKIPTELIVLGHTPFGENSVVLHTLSRAFGRRGLLVRTGPKTPMALFLPLNLLEGDLIENPKSALWRVGNLSSCAPLTGIRNNYSKNAISLFLSEVLFRVVKEGTSEEGLFDWCWRSILTLDALPADYSNFHVRFLLELAMELGFQPAAEDLAPFLGGQVDTVRRILTASFSEAMLIPLSGTLRSDLCEGILRYLEFHTDSAINVRSLAVLRELF